MLEAKAMIAIAGIQRTMDGGRVTTVVVCIYAPFHTDDLADRWAYTVCPMHPSAVGLITEGYDLAIAMPAQGSKALYSGSFFQIATHARLNADLGDCSRADQSRELAAREGWYDHREGLE